MQGGVRSWYTIILKDAAAAAMGCTMVNFANLRVPTAEERARSAAEDQARRYADDDRDRDQRSKKALVITLDHEPETRGLMTGETVVLLRGTEDGRSKSSVAVYTVPARISDDEGAERAFDRQLRDMGGGDKISLAGQWSRRTWKDANNKPQEAWEFKAQHFALGERTLEQILEAARAARGGQVAKEPPVERVAAPRVRHGQDGGMGI